MKIALQLPLAFNRTEDRFDKYYFHKWGHPSLGLLVVGRSLDLSTMHFLAFFYP